MLNFIHMLGITKFTQISFPSSLNLINFWFSETTKHKNCFWPTGRKSVHFVTKFCSYKTYLGVKTTKLYKNSWINVLHREFLVAKLQRWAQMLSIMFINEFSERIPAHSKYNVQEWNSFAISIPKGGRQPIIWPNFHGNCMKLKKIFFVDPPLTAYIWRTQPRHTLYTHDEPTVRLVWNLYQFSRKDILLMERNSTYSVNMLTFIIMDQTFVLLECTWKELQGHLSSSLGSSIFSTKFETKSI